jgi:hypothetical protein
VFASGLNPPLDGGSVVVLVGAAVVVAVVVCLVVVTGAGWQPANMIATDSNKIINKTPVLFNMLFTPHIIIVP